MYNHKNLCKMTLVKRNPNARLSSIFDEFLTPEFYGGMSFKNNIPAVNIKENETDFTIELAAPGLKKEDFYVEVDNNVLTISAEVKNETTETDEKGKYSRKEFSYNSFKRSFTLPETINEDTIVATYEHGVLNLTMPKKEEALPKAKRLIEIA